ncbi:glycosyltransferase [Weissella diestrammenae]|uniref:glycosyltransferase n=1 Tax=Weissella diestrammenae TaxID=1162633 RepID=UPI00195FCEB6|nr:glycosyltransferase [Weissella diestrammenae]MCM0583274.1 glycosyltransferase [Weissella diestrammenae]
MLKLENNVGLGSALNYGLQHATNELIVRMDADDISLPERVEKQLAYLVAYPATEILSANIEEIDCFGQSTGLVKKMPVTNTEIRQMMVYRNPINHPAVVFKKSVIEAVGGYQDLYHHEDYFLWVRLFEQGHVFGNVDEVLVKMRMTQDSLRRRQGWQLFQSSTYLSRYMLTHTLMTRRQYRRRQGIYLVKTMMPVWLLKKVYQLLLRTKC